MTIVLGRPQIVLLLIMAIGYIVCFRRIVLHEGKDGFDVPQTYALATVEGIITVVVLALLWAGGFFKG